MSEKGHPRPRQKVPWSTGFLFRFLSWHHSYSSLSDSVSRGTVVTLSHIHGCWSCLARVGSGNITTRVSRLQVYGSARFQSLGLTSFRDCTHLCRPQKHSSVLRSYTKRPRNMKRPFINTWLSMIIIQKQMVR